LGVDNTYRLSETDRLTIVSRTNLCYRSWMA